MQVIAGRRGRNEAGGGDWGRERERVDFSGTGLWGTQLFLKNCFIVLYLIVVIKNSNTQTQTMGSTFKEVGVGGSKQLPLLHVKIKGPVS